MSVLFVLVLVLLLAFVFRFVLFRFVLFCLGFVCVTITTQRGLLRYHVANPGPSLPEHVVAYPAGTSCEERLTAVQQ